MILTWSRGSDRKLVRGPGQSFALIRDFTLLSHPEDNLRTFYYCEHFIFCVKPFSVDIGYRLRYPEIIEHITKFTLDSMWGDPACRWLIYCLFSWDLYNVSINTDLMVLSVLLSLSPSIAHDVNSRWRALLLFSRLHFSLFCFYLP